MLNLLKSSFDSLLEYSVNKKEIVHNSECWYHFDPPLHNVVLYYHSPLLEVFTCKFKYNKYQEIQKYESVDIFLQTIYIGLSWREVHYHRDRSTFALLLTIFVNCMQLWRDTWRVHIPRYFKWVCTSQSRTWLPLYLHNKFEIFMKIW